MTVIKNNQNDLLNDWLKYSWIRRAISSYSDRMRVDNFSPVGNLMFQAILRRVILGQTVYFEMVENKQKEEDRVVQSTVPQNNNILNDAGVLSDDNSVQYATKRIIKSSHDPVDVDTIKDYVMPAVSYTDYGGNCYDTNDNIIPNLFCIKLDYPPITQQAKNLAIVASDFDNVTKEKMRSIATPTPYISGTDNTVSMQKKPVGEEENSVLQDAVTVPHSQQTGPNGAPIKADVGILAQWDSDKMFAYQQSKAIEFIGETRVPPVDFPETNALGQTAQALVSNREPFVSKVASIKLTIDAVFYTAGIKKLSWQLLFPYTPQDIASIGDAAGKGVDAGSLQGYGDSLA